MSGPQVCMGATLMCSFGVAPSTMVVLPVHQTVTPMPAANIGDSAPIMNIPPFGACTSLANPTVASATAAAMGVLTPMPCVPAPAGPWVPGNPKVILKGMPTLDASCKATCSWGGLIQIINPGQFKVIDA
ncbi:DUF4280 domain-containing protein [Polyangium aurulentum]|uniref:DUF4280 domain-containing protein n=1 Tax=Polyangium aurulentum TaxID=2567896 RepID=UPI0010AE9537|nr:DUF4280 domain-containing protein [Polyangium aurulentum]UQA56302.1 DUF4280 domain-containing protein [Polyangium aurulentum]